MAPGLSSGMPGTKNWVHFKSLRENNLWSLPQPESRAVSDFKNFNYFNLLLTPLLPCLSIYWIEHTVSERKATGVYVCSCVGWGWEGRYQETTRVLNSVEANAFLRGQD